ncbi:hypothetical protein [Bosea sp. (in: a-proteobacteria)]|uniref:hypothetical protein n=1 Tax=Bosea sp. (in: a-proteobacteria) TaxID=1871050 RepID=UPI003B3ACAC6
MPNTTFRIALCLAAFPLAALMPQDVAAEASCLPVGDRTARSELDRFKQAPGGFLADIRNDPEKISGLISSFVASDPGLLDAVRQLVASSGTAQRRAIGMGLASAAARCTATRPVAASTISDFARKGESNVTVGFLSQGDVGRAALPPSSRPRPSQGGALIEGEFGEKLKDPFADPEIP